MQVKSPPSPSLFQALSIIKNLLLTSCFPLFAGILCNRILCLADFMNAPLLLNKESQGLENQGNLLLLLVNQAKDVSFGVYSSFLHFFTAMMIIHTVSIMIQRLKLTQSDDLKKEKTTFHPNVPLKTKGLKKMNLLILSIFGYTIAYITIYSLYALIIGVKFEEVNSLELNNSEYLSSEIVITKAPLRMLVEEDILHHEQPIRADKKNYTTFPLGRVLGTLNIDAASIVFSKDETLLFASRANRFAIIMADVSDWENPRIIQEKLIIYNEVRQSVSLTLSDDGKTVLASNMDYFAVIEFTPNSMKFYNPFVHGLLPTNLNFKFENSLTPLPDNRTVLISGYGLEIFDISERREADIELINYDLPSKDFNLSTTAVSSDGQILYALFNGVLNIHNITDLKNWHLISSFESQNVPCSFVQSKDGRRLTIIGFQKGTNKVFIERIDVSNVKAPKSVKTFPLNVESFSSLFGLKQSPKETYLYFTVKDSSETKMMLFDVVNEKLLEDSQDLLSRAKSLLFSSNEDCVMAVFPNSVLAIQLYRHSLNDRIFSISKETFAQISTVPNRINKLLKLFSSPDGKFLLSVDESYQDSKFTFSDVSNRSQPIEINSFLANKEVTSLAITENGKILSVTFRSKIIIYDISDLKSINILGSYALDKSSQIVHAVFTSDVKICYAMTTQTSLPRFKTFDLSDPASIKEIDSFRHLSLVEASDNLRLILSKDEKSLLAIDQFIYKFEISDRKINPNKVRSQTTDHTNFVAQSISLSSDGRVLVLKRDDLRSSSLELFDVIGSGIVSLNNFTLPKPKEVKRTPVGFSPDCKLAYTEGFYGGQPGLLVLNISDPSSVIFQSVIQAEGFTQGSVDNFIISDDGETAYLASNSENKIYVVNIETLNSVFLGTESFRLGERSSVDVMILKQNSKGAYVPLDRNYRFVKASLFSTKIVSAESSAESKLALLPNWMTFQKESGTLVVEPKKQSDLKTYTLYTAFSTQLNQSSFKSLYDDAGQIQALISALMIIGYLDSELYVTGNLGSFDNFFLMNQDRDKIYKILRANYFETFTMFDVVPSLDLVITSSKKKLEVQTPSESLLKVEISFGDAVGVQFLKKKYGPLEPLITENKTKLVMEGSFEDVNEALENLVVNSEFENREYEGTITIWDHLNPSIKNNFKNLSSYFEFNEAPKVNPKEGFAVQSQIDSRAIYTGEYFSLILFNNTFIDKYSADTLRFTLVSDNKERSPAPSWLTFNDLILKGTPPEEVLHRSVNLVLIVQNEFRRLEVPITLNVRLSATFILKLLIKNSPYILTVLGLWVFANRIYNVLRKDKYRHHQDFYIPIGQEINSNQIYPISFLGQEGEESELIWKYLWDKRELLDKSNINEDIKKIVEKLPEKDLFLYHNGSDLSKKLIEKLVMNHMALWLIDSKEEKETKKIYEEEIEYQLTDLVKWENDGSCKINEPKLAAVLKKALLKKNEEEEGIEVGLINQTVINVDLLKDVILAEAMKCQSLKIRKLFTHLIIKEEAQSNLIKRFLKKNLYDLQTAREGLNTVYGINYEIKNDVLSFSGVAQEKFCGKTIVLQITNLKQKILKEVWIHGIKKKPNNDERSESVALGRNYEML